MKTRKQKRVEALQRLEAAKNAGDKHRQDHIIYLRGIIDRKGGKRKTVRTADNSPANPIGSPHIYKDFFYE